MFSQMLTKCVILALLLDHCLSLLTCGSHVCFEFGSIMASLAANKSEFSWIACTEPLPGNTSCSLAS